MWNAFQKAIHDGTGWREVSILTLETMKNHTGSESEIFDGVLKIAEKVLTRSCVYCGKFLSQLFQFMYSFG